MSWRSMKQFTPCLTIFSHLASIFCCRATATAAANCASTRHRTAPHRHDDNQRPHLLRILDADDLGHRVGGDFAGEDLDLVRVHRRVRNENFPAPRAAPVNTPSASIDATAARPYGFS